MVDEAQHLLGHGEEDNGDMAVAKGQRGRVMYWVRGIALLARPDTQQTTRSFRVIESQPETSVSKALLKACSQKSRLGASGRDSMQTLQGYTDSSNERLSEFGLNL